MKKCVLCSHPVSLGDRHAKKDCPPVATGRKYVLRRKARAKARKNAEWNPKRGEANWLRTLAWIETNFRSGFMGRNLSIARSRRRIGCCDLRFSYRASQALPRFSGLGAQESSARARKAAAQR